MLGQARGRLVGSLAFKSLLNVDHTRVHGGFSPINDCVLESTAIAQKAAKNHCFSSALAGEMFVQPMWILDRPKSKKVLIFGAGEVQVEFHGLGTTHASYVIGDLTKIAVFCTK